MSNPCSDEQEEATVVGFEAPNSPDSSYDNVYPGTDDEAREPPLVPPHLEAPRSVVALGFTHRFRSKYVTVVLYKPVPRRGSGA
ncbi:hypothetical protein Ancab_030030 [Ancistrocladus abbreviatus]